MADSAQTVLVLGAYGLIGSVITRHLNQIGHKVIGHGRDPVAARRAHPDIDWHFGDLRAAQSFDELLEGVTFVVNCTGALQDGPSDDLMEIHCNFVRALAQACEKAEVGLIQISACGARLTSDIAFYATKAMGEDAIRAVNGRWWILRPGLVLAQDSYGGTALLRMVAATPIVQPLAMPDTRVQTVSAVEVAVAVTRVLAGKIPPGTIADLVEDETHTLQTVISVHRNWLGFPEERVQLVMPGWALAIISRIADFFRFLGWRTPLCTTSLRVLKGGITGDPAPWRGITGASLMSLQQTMASLPAGPAQRLHARMALWTPIIVAVLALFWTCSGLIGLLRLDAAATVLTDANWPDPLARASVIFFAFVDILLGMAILWRPWAQMACLGMAAVSLTYLALSSVIAPALWLDPLGPLLKILPALSLALVAHSLLEKR